MNGRLMARFGWRMISLATVAVALVASPGPAHGGDIEYGAYLAQDCSSCHQNNSHVAGIPEIAGLPTDYFISALMAYIDGQRDHSTMRMIARSLDAEQIAALAAYYAQE